MFEGLLTIIEAWLTRELSLRRRAFDSYGDSLDREEAHSDYNADYWIDLRDLHDVYHLLEQVVERIHARDSEN